ncbi:hypothetical protein BDF21DRAFT_486885 [Thamnidium elegans]|nr:hypothetical protein BDF21DRAFT_486885 [Thamnidium elegans]
MQWGDAVSPECKRLNLDFKLDIRFISVASLKALKIPIVLVMGLNCHIFFLSIIDKNV